MKDRSPNAYLSSKMQGAAIAPKVKGSTDKSLTKGNKHSDWTKSNLWPKGSGWGKTVKTATKGPLDIEKKKKFELDRTFLLNQWLYRTRFDHSPKFRITRDDQIFNNILLSFKENDESLSHNIPDVIPNI